MISLAGDLQSAPPPLQIKYFAFSFRDHREESAGSTGNAGLFSMDSGGTYRGKRWSHRSRCKALLIMCTGGFIGGEGASQEFSSPMKSKAGSQSLTPVTIKCILSADSSDSGDGLTIHSGETHVTIGNVSVDFVMATQS